jgi:hypothetical protein
MHDREVTFSRVFFSLGQRLEDSNLEYYLTLFLEVASLNHLDDGIRGVRQVIRQLGAGASKKRLKSHLPFLDSSIFRDTALVTF